MDRGSQGLNDVVGFGGRENVEALLNTTSVLCLLLILLASIYTQLGGYM
jgi:hypothetical protein